MNRLIKKFHLFALITLFCFPVFAEDSIILINKDNDLGKVNKLIFGTNFIAHDPSAYRKQKSNFGNTNYGAGIWDPALNQPVKEVIDLAKNAGIRSARFPGGMGANYYEWEMSIGNHRENYFFGLNEFFKIADQIKAVPIFTINFFTNNENDAGNLVEYLNISDEKKHTWAGRRIKDGHPKPYDMKYIEIGNEVWDGDLREILRRKMSPNDYAQRYLKYFEAVKLIDPTIQVGVVLHTAEWNKTVISMVRGKVDFGILHTYPTPAWGRKLENIPSHQIFEVSLAKPGTHYQNLFDDVQTVFKKYVGHEVPLAITEFNGGYAQDEPIPYRHTMGCALVNAELLRVFLKPENHILMANYWNFANEYWGMIANGFHGNPKDLYNPYYKRPNYYVFEMYAKHFGDILISNEVKSGFYKYQGKDIPYLSVSSSKNSDGSKVYLMVVNKDLDKPQTATITLNGFEAAAEGNAWVLNGPAIDATNEENHNNVKITQHSFQVPGSSFEFTFEPHSLTAIELVKKAS